MRQLKRLIFVSLVLSIALPTSIHAQDAAVAAPTVGTNGVIQFHDLDVDGVSISLQPDDGSGECVVQTVARRREFIQHYKRLVETGAMADLANGLDPDTARHNLYLQYFLLMEKPVTKLIMSRQDVKKNCHFKFGFSGEEFNGPKQFSVAVAFLYSKDVASRIDWETLTNEGFIHTVYGYYIWPIFEQWATREALGINFHQAK
ncbi:hypothetical protein [Asaia spathodeae]|uniref:Uncharacterized protein n=1 Tax=Asaia spathodeae TaxID=657016 RepID=A0ABX2P7M0_9PROT|nr:hypothetical protein [Asaia spathodeae]GBR21000.1 hypothetical protein AA105894_2690 [Asaia spathodeae NBRC 105894]